MIELRPDELLTTTRAVRTPLAGRLHVDQW